MLVPGGTRQFTATTRDAAGNTLTGRTVSWATTTAAVATVGTSGLVTAVGAGTTQLTATSEGRTANATVTVLDGAAIGATGGTVTAAAGAAVITVPAGALGQSTTITVKRTTTPPASDRLVAETAYDFGPSGTTFTQPVTIKLQYSAAAVASKDPNRFRLHRYTNSAWTEVPGSTVDVTERTVTGQTSSFSTYAILELPAASVATVQLTPDSSDVEYLRTRTLTVATLDEGGSPLEGRPVTWLSSAPTIASVSDAGVVTGLVPGAVTITATSEGKSATARIRVVPGDLTRIVDSLRAAFNLPALGATIVSREHGVLAIGVAGVRRWGTQFQVTQADKWHIGSNTKNLTGFLAGVTVAAGRLGWDDLMVTRYPQLAPLARAELQPITIRDLATMQSGIVGNPTIPLSGTLAQQRAAVDQWAVQQPPEAPRGSYFYSNISYQILGEILGRAWGTSFEPALQNQVWTPLGITNSGFGPTTGAGQTNQPSGHSPSGAGWTICESCDNSWASGSGRIHMSLGDWSTFIREVMRADAGQSALMPQQTARLLTSGATLVQGVQSYGYGWIVNTSQPNNRYVTHDGSNNRNRSRASIFLDAGVAFLMVTNAGDPVSVNGGAPNLVLNALQPRLQSFRQTGQ